LKKIEEIHFNDDVSVVGRQIIIKRKFYV